MVIHLTLYSTFFIAPKISRNLSFIYRGERSLTRAWRILGISFNLVAFLFVFLTEALDLNNLFISQLNFTMFKLFLQHRINFDEVMIMRGTLSYSFMTPFCKVHKNELWFTYLLWQLRRWHWYILVSKKNLWTFWYLCSWFSGHRESENGNRLPLMPHCCCHLSQFSQTTCLLQGPSFRGLENIIIFSLSHPCLYMVLQNLGYGVYAILYLTLFSQIHFITISPKENKYFPEA